MTEVSNETRFLHAIEIGLGAWQWGDRVVWGYGQTHTDKEIRESFDASLNLGVRFVDTAEIYGSGYSERLLGSISERNRSTRAGGDQILSVAVAVDKRIYPARIERKFGTPGPGSQWILYQIHWASPLMSPETMMEGMVECVKRGWTRTVGVSNFGQKHMLRAYSTLAQHGIPLASNQVHYSLLNREVEKNGTLARCKELGIRMIAYSPLEKGLLTGKYTSENPPPGVRGSQYAELLKKLPPVIKLLQEIGLNHGDKTVSQVALNWLICKGALPIPGAKNVKQAELNAGGAGWRLTEEEVAKLDEATDNIREYKKE